MDFKIAIETFDEDYPVLIDPAVNSKGILNFTTIKDKQKLAVIKVFLVNSRGRHLLKEFKISHIKEAPAGTPRITIKGKILNRSLKLKIKYNKTTIEEDIVSIKKYTRSYTGLLLILVLAVLAGGIYYAKSNFFSEKSSIPQTEEKETAKEQESEEITQESEYTAEKSPENTYIQEKENMEETPAVIPEPEPEPQPVIINKDMNYTIYFSPDSPELVKEEISKLDKISEELNSAMNISITISGHSAPKGFEDGRKELSQKRAESIKNYFNRKSISSEITTESYGDEKPVTMDPKKQNLNRRAELIISYQIEEKQE